MVGYSSAATKVEQRQQYQYQYQFPYQYQKQAQNMAAMHTHETIGKLETYDKQATAQVATVPCKYKTGKELGSGTFAVVKELVHIETGKRYAGKIISKEKMVGKQNVIRNELEILKKLSRKHPHIVSLVDYFETMNNVYLVTELCTGGELFDYFRRRTRFTERNAASIVRQIVEGVDFLHSHGVVHRDLKTENCLVKDKGDGRTVVSVAIADFGMARVLAPDGAQPLTSLCGTPGYMAPEMIRRLGHGKPVDMWAVGVIAYFLLSGTNPFARNTTHIEMKAVIDCDYAFEPATYWSRISDAATNFISSLLRYDPAARLTARQALAHPWLAAADMPPSTTTTPLPSPGLYPAAATTTPQQQQQHLHPLHNQRQQPGLSPQASGQSAANSASSGAISGKLNTRANVFYGGDGGDMEGGGGSSFLSAAAVAAVAAAAAAAAAADAGPGQPHDAEGDQEMADVQLSSSIERGLARFQLASSSRQTPPPALQANNGGGGAEPSGLTLRLHIPRARRLRDCDAEEQEEDEQDEAMALCAADTAGERREPAGVSAATSTTLASPATNTGGGGSTTMAIPIIKTTAPAADVSTFPPLLPLLEHQQQQHQQQHLLQQHLLQQQMVQHQLMQVDGVGAGNIAPTYLLTPVASIATLDEGRSFGAEASPSRAALHAQGLPGI
ncbi:Calcium/calmodulin-dependent protein kinase type I [Coemansia sp. RSA 1804]|nr:Calcium/calmodulin-dependent protein kinase type I [Coemansia sp. RSA 1804]